MSLVKADIRLSSYDLQSLLQCCDKVEKVGLTEIGEDGELTGPIPLTPPFLLYHNTVTMTVNHMSLGEYQLLQVTFFFIPL
jgi:ribosomal protein S10